MARPLSPKGYIVVRERVQDALTAGVSEARIRSDFPAVQVWSQRGVEVTLARNNPVRLVPKQQEPNAAQRRVAKREAMLDRLAGMTTIVEASR